MSVKVEQYQSFTYVINLFRTLGKCQHTTDPVSPKLLGAPDVCSTLEYDPHFNLVDT
jgi:hypothetical protein